MDDFSLIILCGKHPHLLGPTLDSLSSQEKPFEVLLLGDVDRGKQMELRSSYPELHLRVVEAKGGKGALMNRGVRAARGSYVQFLEPGDRYISQHALSFLRSLLEKKPHLIFSRGVSEESSFFWLSKEKIMEWGGFDETLRFCPVQDLLYRFEKKGAQICSCPRVLIDGSLPAGSWREMCKVLYRHFGLRGALRWFFVQNRPRIIKRAALFMKRSFWSEE